jgi:hypothetical protein
LAQPTIAAELVKNSLHGAGAIGPYPFCARFAERRVPYARDEQRRFSFGKSETRVSVFRCRSNDHDPFAAPGGLFEPPMRRRNLENHESRAWTLVTA